ncbi:MAG: ankyrin repeat domain-containing protein [Candidatus Berkiella sp.]
MLHAFDKARGASNASNALILPEDDDDAITFALSKNSLPLLLEVKARNASALDHFVKGKTALMNAVLKDDARAIKLLSEAGADINLRTRSGDSALLIAAQENKSVALKQLLACQGVEVALTNKQSKTALQIAFEKKNVEIFVLIACASNTNDVTVKKCINQYLLWAIKNKNVQVIANLIKIPNINVNTKVSGQSLLSWAIKVKARSILDLIFPLSKHLLDYPLKDFIKDFKHFDTVAKYEAFYRSNDPLIYVESFSLCDPVTLEALKMLILSEKAAKQDKIKERNDTKSESAMDDKKVSGANLHFEKKVKPHFKAQYEATGLEKIEQRIREEIVKAILEEATLFKDEAIVEFITKSKADLVNGLPTAMQDSVNIFNKSSASHAAWRCYNPFAKVTGDWPNLHTRPEKDHSVFSTQASAFVNGTLKCHQASDIVRERTAYYFLAVIDPDDGNEQARKERLGNFIGLLAEIRNAHNADDPSCFPGQLTRIASMGNYHTLAQQPSCLKEVLATYFRSKVFQQFKEKVAEQDDNQRQQLLQALTQLTYQNAREHITDPRRFSSELLALRQSFISSLGNEVSIAAQVKQETSYPLDDDDIVYIQQHLVDITKGDIALSLSEYTRRLSDRPATVKDIEALALFGDDLPKHQELFKSLMLELYNQAPTFRKSIHQLHNVAEYFANTVCQLFEHPENISQYLVDLVEVLELEPSSKQQIKEKFLCKMNSCGFKLEAEVVKNPFADKLKALIEQLKHTRHPLMVARFEQMIPQLQQKAELFAHFIPYLGEALAQQLDGSNKLAELVEMLVEHCVVNGQFNQQDFIRDLPQSINQSGVKPMLDSMLVQLPNEFIHKATLGITCK